jgi:beta-glucuronidase
MRKLPSRTPFALVSHPFRATLAVAALATLACASGRTAPVRAAGPIVTSSAVTPPGPAAQGGATAPNDDLPDAPPPLIQNVTGRATRSLDGPWHAIVDPYDNGYYDYRLQPHTTDGYFANRKPASKSDRVEYDFDRSDVLSVPGDWNSQRKELFLYEGTVWYERGFDATPEDDRRLFVYFGAANYDARVYVNGRPVGRHVGGFTPFNFEITSSLRSSGNFIVAQVDNRRRRDGVPTVNTDWWNYGGLTRDVLLVDVPRTFIRDYAVGVPADGAASGRGHRLSGWVQLDGPRPSQDVTLRIADAGATTTVRTDAKGFARFDVSADVALWSPDAPKLYAVDIAAETDRIRDRIGFRTVATRGADILVDEMPVFLRGISIHEQAPMREGRAYSASDARTLLGWARELGANFVRLAHYPHNENMLRAADEMGLLVWAEIPVYWTIDWGNPHTLENARRQLGEVIARDRNRASAIIWSVGNETPEGAARLTFMQELVRTARTLDPTRLVAAALERSEPRPGTQRIDDPLGGALDVLGCNEYLGWYDGLPDKADTVSWESAYDKPLVMSEFGADALQGLHGDALTRWSEEYQASVYEHQLRMLATIPFLRGMSPWILADFRSPRRPLPGIQDFWNRKGLISDRGVKKQAFSVLQREYQRIAREGLSRAAPLGDAGP